MTQPVSDTQAMIGGMNPTLDNRSWCFVSADEPDLVIELMRSALATFREDEGLSLIVPHAVAVEHDLAADPFARITLQVHSALEGVGLTAAVSGALADAKIPCNMVAALRHDHVFVPAAMSDKAMEVLGNLQAGFST